MAELTSAIQDPHALITLAVLILAAVHLRCSGAGTLDVSVGLLMPQAFSILGRLWRAGDPALITLLGLFPVRRPVQERCPGSSRGSDRLRADPRAV